MKTIFIFLCILSFAPVSSFCQTEHKPKYAPARDKHKNKTDELDRKQGLWKHYSMDGVLTWEVEYLDDRRHGISKRYYGNGRIMRETEYQYGRKDGTYKRYDYDGVITEGEYSLGKKVNHWINYYSGGHIKSEGQYNNGVKNGEWKYYNRKGLQTNTILFKEGRDVRDILAEEKKATKKNSIVSKH